MVTGISFSYANNSMNKRGLQLLSSLVNMQVFDMNTFDIPLCNSNKSDGIVPDTVDFFDSVLEQSDALIFAVPEATAHYSAAFKNAMDWLVVKANFNSALGTNYTISNKPIYVVTFTPVYKEAGHRHFDMTTHLLQEKLGADVRKCFVKRDCWRQLLPTSTEFVQDIADYITDDLNKYSYTPSEEKQSYDVNRWLELYNEWDAKWKV